MSISINNYHTKELGIEQKLNTQDFELLDTDTN